MKIDLNEELIRAIKQHIPAGENVANWLCDNLKIERESAYRRLRGNVIFTFEEIVKISSKLGFSLDTLVDSGNTTHALFDMELLNKRSSYIDMYRDRILEYANLYRKLNLTGKLRMGINSMPHLFSINKPLLSKFRIYKWIYQLQGIKSNLSLSDFEIPADVHRMHDYYQECIKNIPHAIIIMDNNVFLSLVRDISYFRKRSLISDNDLEQIKNELNQIVDYLESVMSTGKSAGGGLIDIYLSSVDLEATYLHIENGEEEHSNIRMYSISSLDSTNKNVCQFQKDWIESLKKFSTVITQSGEIERFKYLDIQRNHIKGLQ